VKTKITTVRLPPELYARLVKHQRTIEKRIKVKIQQSQIIRQILEEGLPA
jgi:predicted DNA-binding protein